MKKTETKDITNSTKDIKLMSAARDFVYTLNPRFVDYIIANDEELQAKFEGYNQQKVGLIRRLRPKKNKNNLLYAQTLVQLNSEWNKKEELFTSSFGEQLFVKYEKENELQNDVTSMIADFKNSLGL